MLCGNDGALLLGFKDEWKNEYAGSTVIVNLFDTSQHQFECKRALLTDSAKSTSQTAFLSGTFGIKGHPYNLHCNISDGAFCNVSVEFKFISSCAPFGLNYSKLKKK
jgi:hypothetical protein